LLADKNRIAAIAEIDGQCLHGEFAKIMSVAR
jgi:hypothetical protein